MRTTKSELRATRLIKADLIYQELFEDLLIIYGFAKLDASRLGADRTDQAKKATIFHMDSTHEASGV